MPPPESLDRDPYPNRHPTGPWWRGADGGHHHRHNGLRSAGGPCDRRLFLQPSYESRPRVRTRAAPPVGPCARPLLSLRGYRLVGPTPMHALGGGKACGREAGVWRGARVRAARVQRARNVASTGLPPCRRLTNLLIWLTTTCCWLMCAAPLCCCPPPCGPPSRRLALPLRTLALPHLLTPGPCAAGG